MGVHMNKYIPIVMTIDNNYIKQVITVIYSVMSNLSLNYDIKVYILHGRDFYETNKNRIRSLTSICNNLEIQFILVDEYLFEGACPEGHITLCSYYRLAIDKLINEDKCIFLDGDIIVQCDVGELYDFDIDDYYIAGVRDFGFRINPEFAMSHARKYHFPSMKEYINAGVLLFNIKKIRSDNMGELLISEVPNQYLYDDQDIMNKVFANKIKILPEEYNCFHRAIFERNCRWRDVDCPKIIHFAGVYKPWKNTRMRFADIWWKYAEEILGEDDYVELREKADRYTEQLDLSYLLKIIKVEKEIVVFGYSRIGLRLYDFLKNCNVQANIVICDNNTEKIDFSSGGVRAMSAEKAIKEYKNAFWINSSQKYRQEICEQLLDGGIQMERLWAYYDKTDDYLECIDEKFLQHEFDEKKFLIEGEQDREWT